MAAVTQTNNPQRHCLGDLIARFYDLSGNNGDTFTLSSQSSIRQVIITPTTSVAVGATVAGSVVTFVTGGAWAARVQILSREG